MAFVVILHFLSKGNLLPSPAEPLEAQGYGIWIIEAFAIVAVNCYVLLTGYFLCEKSFRLGKLIESAAQVWFYSYGILLLLLLSGTIRVGSLSSYDFYEILMPIQMNHYWFMTTYLLLYLLSPILNLGINNMTKSQLQVSIVLLLVYESLLKSLLPIQFANDQDGYGIVWFICLYLIAAYCKKYGIHYFKSAKQSFLHYVLFVGAIFVQFLVWQQIYFKLDAFGDSINNVYHYNHIFVLAASISLFYAFSFLTIKEGWIATSIHKISPFMLGIYLFHEHTLLRYQWPNWFQFELPWWANMILGVIGIMVIGIVLDLLRTLIFHNTKKIVRNLWNKNKSNI